MSIAISLNGWWRLWTLFSCAWVLGVAACRYQTYPFGERAPHDPSFLYQLQPAQRQHLEMKRRWGGITTAGTNVDMPNGHQLRFSYEAEKAHILWVTLDYDAITIRAKERERLEHFTNSLALAFIPCTALALLGVGIVWVREGFKNGVK